MAKKQTYTLQRISACLAVSTILIMIGISATWLNNVQDSGTMISTSDISAPIGGPSSQPDVSLPATGGPQLPMNTSNSDDTIVELEIMPEGTNTPGTEVIPSQ